MEANRNFVEVSGSKCKLCGGSVEANVNFVEVTVEANVNFVEASGGNV